MLITAGRPIADTRWLGALFSLALTACVGSVTDANDAERQDDEDPATQSDSDPSGDPGNTTDDDEGGADFDGVVAPPTEWVDVTNNLTTVASGGGEVAFLSADPHSARLIAALARVGLFVTEDAGATWSKLGSGSGSASITHGPTSIVYDPDHPGVFWESGIYGAWVDGIYTTQNSGQNFTQLGTIGHNDYVTVDFTDPDRQTLLAGAHEAERRLFKSVNGGTSWEDIGANLPNSNHSSYPLIIDSQTYLLGASGYGGGPWGVFRSTDGGATWTSKSTEGPGGWPFVASDGRIYWLLQYDQGIIMSSDQGQTWTKGGAGPIRARGGGLHELPDGRILALGSTHIMASSDKGATWSPIGDPMPYPGANCQTYGFAYSVHWKALFINHNNCSGNLIPESVWRAGFDYTVE